LHSRQAWSEDISLFNPPKSFLTAAGVLLKKSRLGLILMAENPKEIQQKAARQNFQLCPLLLKEMFSKSPPRIPVPIGQNVSGASNS
jgi:hypothetical protein